MKRTAPTQRTLDFNPIESTPEERERLRREMAYWTRQEAAEDFEQLPGESLKEFFAARENYLLSLDVFGPAFPRQPCAAWRMIHEEQQSGGVVGKPPDQGRLEF